MSIKLKGSTDGSVTLQAPADTSPTGTDKTLTLPTTTGSANQFVKNGGTAGELEYSSTVEDSSGNVGIGTTNPTQKLHVIGSSNDTIDETTGTLKLEASGGNGLLFGTKASSPYESYIQSAFVSDTSVAQYSLLLNPLGGHILIGQSATPVPGIGNTTTGASFEKTSSGIALFVSRDDNSSLYLNRNSDGLITEFRRSGVNVGSISVTTSSTAFNTSSDYRLKENVVDLDGAITRVKQLAPKRFNFIADADTTVDGFLAHEAQTVVPEAVTGTHNEVDSDNNPIYQGIDQSKLVPLLTAALQEAIAKIETLETKVAALEATE